MEILKVAIDAVKGIGSGNYTTNEKSEALKNSFIELNGGSKVISPKTFYRGSELYSVVEELIPVIIEEGLKETNPIFRLVEYKNINDGDVNEFYTTGKATFIVADAAAGIRGVRRQRMADGEKVTVTTSMKTIRVYETLGRLLAGRITFNEFVDGVARAFKKQLLEDAYKAIAGITENTAGMSKEYIYAGTYDEAEVLKVIEHVEADSDKTAYIYGTKMALRRLKGAELSEDAKNDLYNLGYYGKFYGTDMVELKQAHKTGTKNFILEDNKIYIVAGDGTPIKMVNEGQGIMLTREAGENNDLTQEYVYGQATGAGVICAEAIGVCTFSD